MDWKHVLDNPDDYGWEELTDLAGDWDTCPVEEVPCDKEGEPQDDELFSLGMEFHTAVCDQKWSKAKDLLFLIEARIKEVLEI